MNGVFVSRRAAGLLATAAMVFGPWLGAAAQDEAVPATVSDVAAVRSDAAVADVAAPPHETVQELGDGDQRLYLVDHHGTWSMHAQNITTATLLNLWRGAGGPEVVTKLGVNRPFTLSVHRLSAERILERLLEGYNYTLHYEASGRLRLVRVYSPESTEAFRVPRLVESLGAWREAETAPPPAPAGN